MKYIFLIFSLFLLNGCSPTNSDLQFKYYLDRGNDAIADKMAELDVVIIEPLEMEQKYIDHAQQAGTIILGYVNAMEADRWNLRLYKQLEPNDFYYQKNGERLYFKEWDSYETDITSAHYQDILLKEIEEQITSRGLDGVFFDTVGNIESFLPKDEQQAQQEAITQLMKRVKLAYPNLKIAQNWGFETLRDYTAPYVDYVLWENFSASIINDKWSKEMIHALEEVRQKHGTQVLTISFKDEEESAAIAKQHQFAHYYHPFGSYYNEW